MVEVAPLTDSLSLYHRLDPETLANPYPLYRSLQQEDPVHWDPYLHAWVLTKYEDAMYAVQHFSSERSPTPEQLTAYGMAELNPAAQVLVRQMIFRDPPAHTRLKALAAAAFTPGRVETLKNHIQEVTDQLIDAVAPHGRMDVIAELADVLPSTITSELMGVPVRDREWLKSRSMQFTGLLGNFQHNPDRAKAMLQVTEELTLYFKERLREQEIERRPGVVDAFRTAEINGDRLSEEEVTANCIITLVGGLETTTNLIGTWILTLLQRPDDLRKLTENPALMPTAVEEALRFESPVQYTARIAPEDVEIRGKRIRKREAVITLLAAANRDPDRFADPDTFDMERKDNRHLAFAWGPHYCFGAPLARAEAQIVLRTVLRRLNNLALVPGPRRWINNMVFRGLETLPITFDPVGAVAAGCAAD